MSGRFAEMILSVCMLLAVELGGFDVEIGTGGYTETPPGWDQELPSGETAGENTSGWGGDTPGSGGDTAEPEGNLSGWIGPEGNQGSQTGSGENWNSQSGSGGNWSSQTGSGGNWNSQSGSDGAWGSQTGSDGNGNIQTPPEDGGSAGQQDNQESWESAFSTATEPSDASPTSAPEPSPLLTLSPEPASSPTPAPTPTLTPEPSVSPSPEPSPAAEVNESSDLSRSAVRPGRLMYWKGEAEAAEELYLDFRFKKEPEILSLRVNGLEADWERENGRIVIRTCSRENRNHVELAVFTEYPWTEGGNRVILTGNRPAAENN